MQITSLYHTMNYSDIDFTVIIPHRDSIGTLQRLFDSIPVSDKIEVILIDNTPTPVTHEDIGINRNYTLLYSEPSRGAGAARNVGIENAHGKWLLFADADDFYTKDAFDIFYTQFNSDAELIYFCMDGIYTDTGERSDRGDQYTQLVNDYLCGQKTEMDIRLGFSSPCSKMVSHELVKRHRIRFEEVPVHNDNYFSLLIGYYANKIAAVNKTVYIATVSKGSLTKRYDYKAIQSGFLVILRCNKFLKEHDLSRYQNSIMFSLFQVRRFGIKKILEFTKLLIKYRQNPLIGYKRWVESYILYKKKYKRDKKYIIY